MGVVCLAGGTGGAKLAAGLYELLGGELAVVANTADDVRALGVHVSPDPDLCTYWLAGEIDEERGWGIAGDSTVVFDRMVQLGAPDWFTLTDRDLATCLRRRMLLDLGVRPTEAQAEVARGLGVTAQVLPMSDQPVETRVRTADGWRGLQQFLVADRAEPEIEAFSLMGADTARPTPEVAAALRSADLVILGPSNPVISIGPILEVPGMRDLIAGAPGPVVGVSPFVAGHVVKGPTEPFMRAAGLPAGAAGVLEAYGDLLDGFVVDAADPAELPGDGPAIAAFDTLMRDAGSRREVAARTLEFGRSIVR